MTGSLSLSILNTYLPPRPVKRHTYQRLFRHEGTGLGLRLVQAHPNCVLCGVLFLGPFTFTCVGGEVVCSVKMQRMPFSAEMWIDG